MESDKKGYSDLLNQDIGYTIKAFGKYCLGFGWMIVIAAAILCAGVYFAGKAFYKPQYASAATFTVNNVYADQSTYTGTWNGMDSVIATMGYLLDSGILTETIEQELDGRVMPEDIVIKPTNQTNFLTITVTSQEAQLSYDALTLIVSSFTDASDSLIQNVGLKLVKSPEIPVLPANMHDSYRMAVRVGAIFLFLGFGALFMYAYFIEKIRSPEDIMRGLHIPCIGKIPVAKFKKRSHMEEQRLLLDNPRTGQKFTDAFRMLRRRIQQDKRLYHHQVYLISSTTQAEGKTVTSINLAIALAEEGNKVLLVDGDLKNPSVWIYLNLPETSINLSQVLENKAKYSEAVTEAKEYKNLKILGNRKPVEDSAEILSNGNLNQILTDAKKEFDYIIIDTAPIGLVADAAIVAEAADAAIFTVKYDFMTVKAVAKAMEQLRDGNVKVIGGVLNGVMGQNNSYGGYYGEYYGSSHQGLKIEEE